MKSDEEGGKGKGLYATKDFCSGDVIILEAPLVSGVCVHCHAVVSLRKLRESCGFCWKME